MYSLFYDVEYEGIVRLCVVRKTLGKLTEGNIIVGDFVHFRETGRTDEQGRPEAVIERLLPRQTVLRRAESFKSVEPQPIVANARQVLIVASLIEPDVRWGLIDRMIVAARSGGLEPIICLNKVDLAQSSAHASAQYEEARRVLEHYESLGIQLLQTSAAEKIGLDALLAVLRANSTVLAGHSGVGKSSLIRSIQPQFSIRIGAISGYTGKGIHTTTSARRYNLDFGGHVIDTPGIKAFGLWGITRENLADYFPDVEAGTAPAWRGESYQRIMESLPGESTPPVAP